MSMESCLCRRQIERSARGEWLTYRSENVEERSLDVERREGMILERFEPSSHRFQHTILDQ